MVHPDQQYIEALKNNDATLLNTLYEKYAGKIKWMVLKNKGNETDAADIFQEALVAIFNKAKSSDFTLTCPLDAFLYLVCKNKWLNELNKRKVGRVTFTDTEVYNDIGVETFKLEEDCRVQEDRKKLLDETLTEMQESCRQLLRLSWSGKPMDEVADLLKVTYGYARKKKSECMSALIKLVKQSPKFNTLKW